MLVLADVDPQDVIVIQVTSQRPRGRFDVKLDGWKECGLLYPSCARGDKLATLARTDVVKVLGALASNDLQKVRRAAIELLG